MITLQISKNKILTSVYTNNYSGENNFETLQVICEKFISGQDISKLETKIYFSFPNQTKDILLVDFEETDYLLSKKYDAQNIESGTSVLTSYPTCVDKFKENSCNYEKIGNMCFYNVTVILNAATMATASTSIHLIDLPFRNVGTYPIYIIATSNKGALFKAFVYKDSPWLTITTLTGSSYTVTQDEQITFNFCVKIA